MTWGGAETGNPTPGEWWNNGIIYIHDVDNDPSDYYTGDAGFNGVKTWQSAAGSGTWISFVGGIPSNEARVYLPDVSAGDWYTLEFEYDGTGPIGFDAGYFTDNQTV